MSKASSLQLDVNEVVKNLLDGMYQEFPELYPQHAYGYDLDDWQKSVTRKLFLGEKGRVTVRASHGVGKSFLSGILTNMFLEICVPARVAATGPTGKQTSRQYWSYVSQTHDRSVFRDLFQWQKTRMSMKGDEETTFAVWLTSKNPKTIEGFHGPDEGRNLLWIVEEAKTVDDAVYESIQGALTHENNLFYISSTCGGAHGYFYDTHNSKKDQWDWEWVPYYKSSRISEKKIQEWRDMWGENSSIFRARALAEFPEEDDKIICPLSWCERAIIRPDEEEDLAA